MNVKAFEQFCQISHNTRAIGFKDGFQTRWGGKPYFDNHCVPVEKIAREKVSSLPAHCMELLSCIAFGHDLLEDTNVTEDELREKLKQLYFHWYDSRVIVQGIKLLTKSQFNFNLFTYLDEIKSNVYALPVKLADNQHNTDSLIKEMKSWPSIFKGGSKYKNYLNKIEKYQLIRYYLLH